MMWEDTKQKLYDPEPCRIGNSRGRTGEKSAVCLYDF